MPKLRTLRIIAFPGAPNLPIFAAQESGYFSKHDLDVHLETTTSSVAQFERFGAGEFDLAFTAFDNVVAYREGQGAVELKGSPNFSVVMGASQVELSVVVSPDIATMRELRGKSLALDAVNTGFAFVLYYLLESGGLHRDAYEQVAVGATPERWSSVKAGKHAGTITIEPFTSLARSEGFRVLARSTEQLPSYQAGIVAAHDQWAQQNHDLLKSFILAYREGLDWTLNARNFADATSLLQRRMPEIKTEVIGVVMGALLSPKTGLTPGAHITRDGMQTVLDLRARYGAGGSVYDLDRYLNLRCFNEVISR